jgi:serine/threonine protein kinase
VVLVKKNDNSDNIYAMKILKKNFIEKKNQETNVMRERDILASVNNQFIVKLYNTFQD